MYLICYNYFISTINFQFTPPYNVSSSYWYSHLTTTISFSTLSLTHSTKLALVFIVIVYFEARRNVNRRNMHILQLTVFVLFFLFNNFYNCIVYTPIEWKRRGFSFLNKTNKKQITYLRYDKNELLLYARAAWLCSKKVAYNHKKRATKLSASLKNLCNF